MKRKIRPEEPKRYESRKYSLDRPISLQEVIYWAQELGVTDFSKVEFDWNEHEHEAYTYLPERDKDFQKRVDIYKKQLIEYENWVAANEEKLKDEDAKNKERQRKSLETQIRKHEKELKRLSKLLEK